MTPEHLGWPSHGGGPLFTSERAWLDAVNSGFLPLDVRPQNPRDFWGRIDSRVLGSARAALVSSQAHEVRRTGPLAERSERNYLKVLWMLRGRCEVEQGSNHSALAPGQWAVYETGRPYSIRFSDDCRFAVALLPVESCQDWDDGGRRLCATALAPDPAATGALYTVMSSFESAPGSPAAGGHAAIGRAVALLLTESLQTRASAVLPLGRQDRRLRDARRVVQARLGDPALGPQQLADALHVSLRSVYALFRQADTTPAAFIQAERLERCRIDLAEPGLRSRTITDIALANGFGDSAHFCRLFKARFGLTASAWRGRSD